MLNYGLILCRLWNANYGVHEMLPDSSSRKITQRIAIHKYLNTKLSISLLQFQKKDFFFKSNLEQDGIQYTNNQSHFKDTVKYNRSHISENHHERGKPPWYPTAPIAQANVKSPVFDRE